MKALLFTAGILLFTGVAFAADPVLKLDLGSGTTIDLVLIPAGQFTQGSPDSEASRSGDESQRAVKISRDYYLGRTAVTRGQWERFISETRYRTEAETGTSGGYGWGGNALSQRKEFTWRNPGFAQTPEHPVCLVTFPDAQAFCTWLEKKSGRKVTLPTEAQWEYACRAGTTTAWHGPDADIAWHKGNAGNSTHPVDSKPANPWGLFIAGNSSEWCLDWYAPYPPGEAIDPRQDNPNLSDKPRRVLRGGSWNRGASESRRKQYPQRRPLPRRPSQPECRHRLPHCVQHRSRRSAKASRNHRTSTGRSRHAITAHTFPSNPRVLRRATPSDPQLFPVSHSRAVQGPLLPARSRRDSHLDLPIDLTPSEPAATHPQRWLSTSATARLSRSHPQD